MPESLFASASLSSWTIVAGSGIVSGSSCLNDTFIALAVLTLLTTSAV